MISLIAAMSKNRVIGNNNRLPWHIPEELKHFKTTTMGKPMIMGKTTFISMGKKPLPGRTTIVLTRDPNFTHDGVKVANSIEQAMSIAGDVPEIMVVGGAQIYAQFLPIATRLYLTVVAGDYEGDTYFPELPPESWNLVSTEEHQHFTVNIYQGVGNGTFATKDVTKV